MHLEYRTFQIYVNYSGNRYFLEKKISVTMHLDCQFNSFYKLKVLGMIIDVLYQERGA